MSDERNGQARRDFEAARLLERRGQLKQAAERYDALGFPYEAGAAFAQSGALEQAFDAWSRAPVTDPRYRATCVQAIATAKRGGAVPYQLEHFLRSFMESEATGPAERQALRDLATVYETSGRTPSAVELLRRLVMSDPRDQQAASALRRLRGPPVLPKAPSVPPEPPPVSASEQAAQTDRVTFPQPSLATPAPEAPLAPAPALASPLVFATGDLVGERYRLGPLLGRGGMATVFKAHDEELSVDIALKIFLPSEDAGGLERFRRELRVTRNIVHPNVVRVFDIGVFRGQRFLTMELIEGQDLGNLIQTPMSLATRLLYLSQACRGLHAAHQHGVIHRDVKPANLMVTNDGVLKVMDFGVARDQHTREELTASGVFVGTAQYMPPEQIRDSRTLTPAADVYSLGVVAYRLLTGRLPFAHPDFVSLIMQHIEAAPPPIDVVNPEIPPDLASVVMRCLAKKPEERWESAEALAEAFDEVRHSLSW
ncbi:MAG: serine/threonine-protein kinase [Myxococcales bacterium]|nr:serine/threonine-protein kinase [Myxococcales bacterium]